MRSLILASACLLLISQPAFAFFEDDAARAKLAEMQQQMQSQNQATQASLDELKKSQQALEQRLTAVEAMMKGQGLIDLLDQIKRLNDELSNVKGQLEIATHNIEANQQRQRDLYTDIDGRLRKLETPPAPAASAVQPGIPGAAVQEGGTYVDTVPPVAGAAPAAAASASTEDGDFAAAQALSAAGKYREAFDAYEKFLQNYPNSEHAPFAQYALGYAQFSLKNYKASIATQQKLIRQFPDNAKVPDAMFNMANSQIQLSDIDGAKKTLRGLLAKYPQSNVAPNAKRRLAVLDSIKSK
ncbi:MAG TPA: tol-pal system protein YbgF [Methylophilaceae bacterium]|nr:tol-pal system protein YbgF [Methylophilaceae bacterium]